MKYFIYNKYRVVIVDNYVDVIKQIAFEIYKFKEAERILNSNTVPLWYKERMSYYKRNYTQYKEKNKVMIVRDVLVTRISNRKSNIEFYKVKQLNEQKIYQKAKAYYEKNKEDRTKFYHCFSEDLYTRPLVKKGKQSRKQHTYHRSKDTFLKENYEWNNGKEKEYQKYITHKNRKKPEYISSFSKHSSGWKNNKKKKQYVR